MDRVLLRIGDNIEPHSASWQTRITRKMATPHQKASLSFPPFLLMEGGPLNAIEKRVGLFREHAPLVKRRAFVSILLTWLPLLVLSAIQGRAIGHSVPVPFVHDFSAYTRFLLAIPLLLLAENLLGPRIAEAAAHFVTSGVVAEKDYDKFREYLERGLRLRNSTLAEIVIAIFAFIFSFVGFREMSVHVTTWYATRVNDSAQLTLAGWWLLGFCAPLFQFLVFRWLWRLFLWFYPGCSSRVSVILCYFCQFGEMTAQDQIVEGPSKNSERGRTPL